MIGIPDEPIHLDDATIERQRREIRADHRRTVKRELIFNSICAVMFVGGIVLSLIGIIVEPGAATAQYIALTAALTMLPWTIRDIRRGRTELRRTKDLT